MYAETAYVIGFRRRVRGPAKKKFGQDGDGYNLKDETKQHSVLDDHERPSQVKSMIHEREDVHSTVRVEHLKPKMRRKHKASCHKNLPQRCFCMARASHIHGIALYRVARRVDSKKGSGRRRACLYEVTRLE